MGANYYADIEQLYEGMPPITVGGFLFGCIFLLVILWIFSNDHALLMVTIVGAAGLSFAWTFLLLKIFGASSQVAIGTGLAAAAIGGWYYLRTLIGGD